MSASKEVIEYTVKGNEKIIWDPTKDWKDQFHQQLNAYLLWPRKISKDHEAFALQLQVKARELPTLIALLTTREGLKQRGGLFGLGKPSWLYSFCVEALQQFHATQFKDAEQAKQVKANSDADHNSLIAAKDLEIKELKEKQGSLELDKRIQITTAIRAQAESGDLATQIALLKEQLSKKEAKVTIQQAEIETHVSEKTQLQAQVSHLTGRVEDLTKKLSHTQDRADETAQYKAQLATVSEELVKEKDRSAALQDNLTETNVMLSFVLNWIDKLFGNTFGWSPSKFLSQKQEPPLPSKAPEAKEDNAGILSRLAFWRSPEQPQSPAPANDTGTTPQLQ